MGGTGSIGTTNRMVDGHLQNVNTWLDGTLINSYKKYSKRKYHISGGSQGNTISDDKMDNNLEKLTNSS